MTTKTLTAADLATFTGSEQFYRHYFPLDAITLWFANHTIYLPSEH